MIQNGDLSLPRLGDTIGEFFDNSHLRRVVGSLEERDAAGIVTEISANYATYKFKANCTYQLKPRRGPFRWVFTGGRENLEHILHANARDFPANSVQLQTANNMAKSRDGYQAFEFPANATAGSVCRVDLYQKYRVREGRPEEENGTVLNETDILDPEKVYTLIVDSTELVTGFSAKDGPFAAATIGLFVTGIINNSHDPKTPAFILSVIGAGLWTFTLILVVILKLMEVLDFDSVRWFTSKYYQGSVVAISWGFSIVVSAVVIILGSVSAAKE
jgi:hypothetical protein|mmetsp:Transcript_4661/g.5106  ORF Transcript_4661/g.5106 Transcript_4661/m.5106 type:complete len:274 (-) Transcript_4661:125-946(-)|eukprot:CAMPEP_0173149104 /NCGR_PEP_ID=MMETSP1105-20130129/10128_1 /TAXON_ID=2985 /ORGANISM="Ochromonas sp., Strain BG-1" /LENGTH=273 /DNA_ID=CAMNT_0014063909 /DNA_START=22 /DNA_END=846 /DNA_ORIENTATION=+